MDMQTRSVPQQVDNKLLTNAELQARKEQAIPRGLGNVAPFYIDRADNAELWDVEGNRFIDFGCGIAVVNTGHNHPKVKAAVQEQLEKFSHTCVTITPYASAVELAEKLNQLAPGDTPKKTSFVTTGAEAVENCIKVARAHTGRRGVIAFNGGFHGRTIMTMGLTGKVMPYKKLFGPFPGDMYHAPYPIPYLGVSEEESLTALNNLFKVDIAASDVAAIIIEPVQGEGGFYPASNSFMQALRELCDEHGILLIADEIQTGFARTGKFFCTEYSGVEPDLMAVAKGIAGGFPIAAVIGKADIMDAPIPGSLGGTYSGSPIGCAASLAVLEVIKEEKLVERANYIGALFAKRLHALQSRYPQLIGEVRAERGAMIAMELVCNGDSEQPNSELTKLLVAKGQEQGLILISCGFRSNVIRFLPALTITETVINEGLDILEQCFAELD